jgi:hypothetical protein
MTGGHKFQIGMLVDYQPPRGISAPLGAYVITAQLPMRYGQFEYRIKHSNEKSERRATENELREL